VTEDGAAGDAEGGEVATDAGAAVNVIRSESAAGAGATDSQAGTTSIASAAAAVATAAAAVATAATTAAVTAVAATGAVIETAHGRGSLTLGHRLSPA